MPIKLDPKWQETILGIARDEAGKEFAVKGMQDEAQVQTDPSALGAEPALGMDDAILAIGHQGQQAPAYGLDGGFTRTTRTGYSWTSYGVTNYGFDVTSR